jgi:hypothetical protein
MCSCFMVELIHFYSSLTGIVLWGGCKCLAQRQGMVHGIRAQPPSVVLTFLYMHRDATNCCLGNLVKSNEIPSVKMCLNPEDILYGPCDINYRCVHVQYVKALASVGCKWPLTPLRHPVELFEDYRAKDMTFNPPVVAPSTKKKVQ